MALSNVQIQTRSAQNTDILLILKGREAIAAEDIDNLILGVNKNKDRIKNLLTAKNRLTRDIDDIMRQRAKAGCVFCEAQMLDYREFSEFYEAESTILTSYTARLKKKMGRTASTVARPYADLLALHRGLEDIVTLQERAIAVLTGMVNMAGQTLNILTKK
jgi:hypothetical protein